MMTSMQRRSIRVTSLIVMILLWELAAYLADNSTLPPPHQVLTVLYQALFHGDLILQLGWTLWRVLAGFFIAMVLGSFIGILMGRFFLVNESLDSLIVLGLNIPALVIIILCYILLGINNYSAILAVVINKIPVIIVTIREGARSVDRDLLDIGTAFKIKPLRVFRHIYLPQLYPYLMAAARNGLALTWKIVLVVELLGLSTGIGFKLGVFFQLFAIADILAYTSAFILVIFFVEACIFRPIERNVNGWRMKYA